MPKALSAQAQCSAIFLHQTEGPLAISFNEQLDQHGTWRREFALRFKLLSQWLKDHELLSSAIEDRLKRLEFQVRSDKVMVAFVAEFSRGKSEMINAIFFAGYGMRIMPASAGRTTMCPTEMGYDADVKPCLRLLPIETRTQQQSLMEWRMVPEKWSCIDLDVNNPQQIAAALAMVSQTTKVSQDQARALGFWNNQAPEENPLIDSEGMVEVPKWRHALINIAHPLLKQGLVILDTPGLNAIGAEPELTVSLLPQAHAVVFILGADTGVTKSDLEIWREHLVTESTEVDTRLVVLNKIDTLWDELSSAAQIQAQIQRQKLNTAQILGIPEDKVIAVSAQKALVGKVSNDAALLKKSCMHELEAALSTGMLNERQRILRAAMQSGIADLRTETDRVIHIRKRDLMELTQELKGLQGKNSAVIKHMRVRIVKEQTEFDQGSAKIHAVRSVHHKLLQEVFNLLGSKTLKTEMLQLTEQLSKNGLKIGVKKIYDETFERLRANLKKVQRLIADIQTMLTAMFKQLNAEHGFSLQAIAEPPMDTYFRDLDLTENMHLKYLGVSNVFRLAQAEFAERIVRALFTRVRTIHEIALAEVELWSKSAAAQLDTQLRERRRNFARRIEAVDRIQQAAGGLGERVQDIEKQKATIELIEDKLAELTSFLINPPTDEPIAVDMLKA